MKTSLMRRLFDWIWQGQAVAESHRQMAAKPGHRLRLERYAMTAAEIGDRALHPVTPLRSGSGDAVGALLYEQSARSSLRALGHGHDPERDEALKRELGRRLPAGTSVQEMLELLAQPCGVDALRDDTRAEALGALARALLEIAREPERNAQRALGRRVLRLGSTLVALIALGVAGGSLVSELVAGPDLAEGKPWRASSAYEGFSPQSGICDGKRTRIFFHTKQESEPWVEIDLGAKMRVRRIDIQNRRDCCRDRAMPLAVEGSLDGQQWQELARRTEPFSKWTARFASAEVRYVRVKSLKRTYLHLESIEIR